MSRFESVLVANRGEIACRIIRSANAAGYRTVAVYSEVDKDAPHVALADQAICIGPASATHSYLNMDRVLDAAKRSGAQAIHPGYGFLSENESFAAACEQAGIVFIGPTPKAIELMGNKAAAKRKMLAAEVPCVPGYEGEDQSDTALETAATNIGFPLMVKAAAGGGGRGMRLVTEGSQLGEAIKLARSEAANAFGSDELILEKAILQPRHVEVQVFADEMGNTVYLGERDCSVQRRHQKVIEEAPCPVMDEPLRALMGEAAVSAARSINYVGAGTVEFLLDAERNFYFLEMNTRLQVEHPVTEMITGLDLVALQLKVAQGEPLGFEQNDVVLDGHAIEVRLYTEDPTQDFLPMAGKISLWESPVGEGVRVDDGVASGQTISPFYDPMVAKVIAHGSDRETARLRLIDALENTALIGVPSNLSFLLDCLSRPAFVQGEATTAFIEENFSADALAPDRPTLEDAAIAAVIDVERSYRHALDRSFDVSPDLRFWSSGLSLVSPVRYEFEYHAFNLGVRFNDGCFHVSDIDSNESVTIVVNSIDENRASLTVEGTKINAFYYMEDGGGLAVSLAGRQFSFINTNALSGESEGAADEGSVTAPMHGLVTEVFVEKGQQVTVGERLMVLEAMKMQHSIKATIDGVVKQVFASAGKQMAADDVLVEIQPND